MMALPLIISSTKKSCPLIYLKAVSEFLALIFFAVAFGICLDLALYYLFNEDSDRLRDVFLSVSITYSVLVLFSGVVASIFTFHLLSDDFKDDDYCFKKLWKLLGLDKNKTPLPPPFDEGPKEDNFAENAYLQPIVHFKGPGISGKTHPKEAAAAMFSFVYKPGQNLPEDMNYNEIIIKKIPNHVDFESFILDEFPCRPIFDISIEPSMNSPEELICNETIISQISPNVNIGNIILSNDLSKIEKMIGL